MSLTLKALKKTKKFYLLELKKEGLIESKRDKYLKALKIVEKIIKKKENPNKKKNKYFDKVGGY